MVLDYKKHQPNQFMTILGEALGQTRDIQELVQRDAENARKKKETESIIGTLGKAIAGEYKKSGNYVLSKLGQELADQEHKENAKKEEVTHLLNNLRDALHNNAKKEEAHSILGGLSNALAGKHQQQIAKEQILKSLVPIIEQSEKNVQSNGI